MSSDRLFHAFKREVIIKKPEEFKIAVLRDLCALFGKDNKYPIFAGFGNKDTVSACDLYQLFQLTRMRFHIGR
jgi:phosphatidate phosphatase LPIN